MSRACLRPLDLRGDEGVALLERGDRAALQELRHAGGRILDQILEQCGRARDGAQPADAPAGHRPVLGERVDEEDAVLRLHDVHEGRRAAAAEMEQRIDLVGDDPQAVPAAKIEDRLQRLAVGGPAGRVGRRVDEYRLGARRDGRRELLDVADPAIVALAKRHGDRLAAADGGGRGEVRPGRRQVDRLVAGADGRLREPAGSPACRRS